MSISFKVKRNLYFIIHNNDSRIYSICIPWACLICLLLRLDMVTAEMYFLEKHSERRSLKVKIWMFSESAYRILILRHNSWPNRRHEYRIFWGFTSCVQVVSEVTVMIFSQRQQPHITHAISTIAHDSSCHRIDQSLVVVVGRSVAISAVALTDRVFLYT